jgi:maltooligosyltrehalose trehalohydrolase
MRVWAPAGKRVDLVEAGVRHRMRRADRGWWEGDDVISEPGMRYGFSLDGGDVRPDPRSPSQPDGVLGLSEVVDHAAHRWLDGSWRGRSLAGSVIYELYVGTFSAAGTFDGVANTPHLVEARCRRG